MLVIVFHLTLKAMPASPLLQRLGLFGWSGVDLFFVLSGFLIGGILLDNRDAANYYRAFYARRFFRIVPIYTLIVLFFGALWLFGPGLRQWLSSTLNPPMPWYAYFTFTNNLFIAASNNMDVLLAVSWSLAVEEQFYLTLPFLVRKIDRHRIPAFVGSAILAVLVFRSVMCGFGFVTQNQAYVSPWFRADSLMIGFGCALLVRNRRLYEFICRRPLALYASLLLFGGVLYFAGTSLPPVGATPSTPLMTFGLTVVALFYASVMLLSITQPRHFLARVLRIRWIGSIGMVSYFVYLVHDTVLRAVLPLVDDIAPERWSTELTWICGTLAMIAVIVVARISWKLFESPLIRIGHKWHYTGRLRDVEPAAEGQPSAPIQEPETSGYAA